MLYKHYADQIIRRCVLEEEIESIQKHYHTFECGRHFRGIWKATNVLQLGFYWQTLFKDGHAFVDSYDRCQQVGNITKRNPLKSILEV